MLFLDYVTHNDIGVRLVAISRVQDRMPPRLHVLEALGQASALLLRQVSGSMMSARNCEETI